ncbi:MAG: hypothetical protein ACKERG_00685 [Candidatus Hodgkinia cicadicola]
MQLTLSYGSTIGWHIVMQWQWVALAVKVQHSNGTHPSLAWRAACRWSFTFRGLSFRNCRRVAAWKVECHLVAGRAKHVSCSRGKPSLLDRIARCGSVAEGQKGVLQLYNADGLSSCINVKKADKLADTLGCSLFFLLQPLLVKPPPGSLRLNTANVTDAVFLLVVSISEDVMQEMCGRGGYVASWEDFPTLMAYTKLDLWTTMMTGRFNTLSAGISQSGRRVWAAGGLFRLAQERTSSS